MDATEWTGFLTGKKGLLTRAVEEGVFPGAVAGIFQQTARGRFVAVAAAGHRRSGREAQPMSRETLFDLASLTKPLATSMAVLCLLKQGSLRLDEPLDEMAGRRVEKEKKSITLFHLLNHCSGLPAHRPYFEELSKVPVASRAGWLVSRILSEPLLFPPGAASLYSDLGFMLLGAVVERKTGMDMDSFTKSALFEKITGCAGLGFRPLSANISFSEKGKENIAATEVCPWRRKELVGEVHDDNCHALGGICGHAGLFGTMDGVLGIVSFLLGQWQGRAFHPSYRNEDLAVFLRRQEVVAGSTWGLGFDTPAAENSSAGTLLSRESAGHLGFTGTSFWMDPQRDCAIVLLTNRVHPSRENNGIRLFRPYFHDKIVEKLDHVG